MSALWPESSRDDGYNTITSEITEHFKTRNVPQMLNVKLDVNLLQGGSFKLNHNLKCYLEQILIDLHYL